MIALQVSGMPDGFIENTPAPEWFEGLYYLGIIIFIAYILSNSFKKTKSDDELNNRNEQIEYYDEDDMEDDAYY